MRQHSPHTRALIEQLNQPVSLLEKLKGSRDDAAILSAIGDSGEPAAIIDILPFVLAEKFDVAAAAATAVHNLVLKNPTKELPWLDWSLRWHSPYAGRHAPEWDKLSPSQLSLLERFGDASVSLLGMASFHESGFIREAATQRLDRITSGTELSFLVLRLNDWVSNVRDAAYEAIRSRLKSEYGRHFIENLELVSRLQEAERADHKAVIEAINELLQSDECRTVLLESLRSEDRFIRRACFRLAMTSAPLALPEVLRQALDDHDTVIRLWAAQSVSSTLEGEMLDYFLTLIKHDRFMPVRREALRSLVRRNVEMASVALRAALLDTHASMREEARYHLKKISPMDVAAFYRQSLLAGEKMHLYSVISGLGETGSAEDDQLLITHTSHRVARIRRAAIKALARLTTETHIEVFIEGLKDEVPHVSRQALNALASRTVSVSRERIWEISHSAGHSHQKLNALSLLQKLGKWDSICYLLRALSDSDEAVVAMSQLGIQRWLERFNRSFSAPTSEQLANVSSALQESGHLLDENTRAGLRFSMKGFEHSPS